MIALIVRPYAADDTADPRASSYLAGPNGARALFLLVDELGMTVEQLLHPWSEQLPGAALVVLAPQQPPTPREVDALLDWIDEGGTLIYGFGATGDAVAEALGLQLRRTRPDTLGALETVRWTGVAAYPARGTAHAGDGRWREGVDSVPGFRTVFHDTSPALQRGNVDVVLRTQAGAPTLVLLEWGDGRVIAWSDAAPLRNDLLRDGAAALIFARMAHDALDDGDALVFDEYHHGYRQGSPARALLRFVSGTGAGRAVLQASLAGLLLLLLYGHRLGAPLVQVTGRRRSPLEHVDAVAAAYEKAGARQTARRLIVAGLERRLGRRVVEPDGDTVGMDGLPGGERLAAAWRGGELVPLAAAVDDFEAEVRRWK
jgi:hypothetical protein